ncbi:MAG: DUF192 domain-containing protein [Acidobacteriaceae bacterium]|nr:DUF192 domain-containing protein [Acidobacteriaceae bacterium]
MSALPVVIAPAKPRTDRAGDVLSAAQRFPNVFRAKRLLIQSSAIWSLVLAIIACESGPRVRVSDTDGNTKAVVKVEIAETEAAREVGLMYRQHLAENAGMLFVFKQPQHLTFWMKNTEIPLDMIFAGADRTITGIVANAEPFSERQLSVAGDSQYVLEVNGGCARRHGIKTGDHLEFLGMAPNAKD